MKYLRIVLINIALIILASCNTGQDNFDWLLGDWQRSNEKAGMETYESWKKISSTEYLGHWFYHAGWRYHLAGTHKTHSS